MATKSTPLYLGAELRAHAEKAAREVGMSLSAWVRQAIADRLVYQARLADGRAALAEWEALDGPLPPEHLQKAQRELEEAGVLATAPQSPAHQGVA